jgi:hypothetical protein
MPQYKTGDMFQDTDVHALFVTSNSYVKLGGKLTMGAGAAKQLAERYPQLPEALGTKLFSKHMLAYHLCMLPLQKEYYSLVGLFQTKYHWRDRSNLELIAESTQQLAYFADMFYGNIALNYPGIGLGGRTKQEVQPIIDILPRNVWVYEL